MADVERSHPAPSRATVCFGQVKAILPNVAEALET
jgi:hypothetical protein